MSYSFSVRVTHLALAAAAIGLELDKVGENQPIHQRDRAATESAVSELLALCAEPGEGNELAISVSGSCYGAEGEPFRGIGLSININPVMITT